LQVPVVDAFTTLAQPAYEGTASLDDFFYDGLHYTAKGYAVSFAGPD
jgi:lysophospholipase L1-like esterase